MTSASSLKTLKEIDASVIRMNALIERIAEVAGESPPASKVDEILSDDLSARLCTVYSGEEYATIMSVLARTLAALRKAEVEIGGVQLQKDHPVQRHWLNNKASNEAALTKRVLKLDKEAAQRMAQ